MIDMANRQNAILLYALSGALGFARQIGNHEAHCYDVLQYECVKEEGKWVVDNQWIVAKNHWFADDDTDKRILTYLKDVVECVNKIDGLYLDRQYDGMLIITVKATGQMIGCLQKNVLVKER